MATQIGIVKTLTGEVTATAADGSIRTLQVGDRVYANELISTGQAGALEIEFSDGSIMDLGRNSQAMLDSAVFDPSSAVADASEEDVPDDVAAIQQALLEGEDPTEVGEATAAGAGVQGGNEGHDAVFVDYLNPEVTPDAGFETIGVNSEIDDIEEEQLLDGVPTAGLTVVTLDEDELVEGGSVDLGSAGNEFLNFLNGQGISAFTFDSPNGVGDERPEVGDDPADGYFLSGSLVAAYGLDGPNEDDPISFNAVTGSDVTDSNGNPVTSEGQQVKYWVSADGLTVIGYIAGDSDQSEQPSPQVKSLQTANYDGCEGPGEDYPELAEIIFTAQLTPTEEGGSFLVGIFGQFDHAEPDYANGEFVFEDNLLLNLGFTITDADGDSTTGTLQLDVDDDSPVRAGEGEQLATQTGTVTEDGLSFDDGDLSEGNPNNAVAMTVTSDNSDADQSDIESFLGLSAGALEPAVDSNGGSGNATNGSASKSTLSAEAGDIISFNWSFDNNDGGSFNDFAFVVINGEVFELADSNGGDLASNPFTYEVTADGVISIGFGQMNVGDQIVDSSLTVSDLTLNGSPVNGGFDGSLTGWDTLGNVSDTDSLVNSDVTSGNLNTVVNMGADGPGSFGLLQASENEAEQALFQAGMDSLPTLSSKGEAVSYSVMMDGSDSVLVATAGEGDDAREVFTLTIDSDGQWTFDLNDQLDHVAGETAEENFSLITLDENGEPNGSVDSIDFTQLLQIRDFDGDQLIITEDDAGMLSISIQDDIPVATGETVNVSVDEDDIVTDNSTGNDPFDNADDGSYTGEPVTIFGYTTDFFNIFNGGGPATTTGSVSSLVSFGADETGTFSLGDNFTGLEGQGLTSKGDELSFEVNGDTLIASADGRAVFTLELADNGDFTFSLYDQLDHAAGNGENNLPLDLSSVIQATDSDNDTITLENGFVIDVTDDIPEQAGVLPDIGIVEEEALPAGNQEENDGSIFGYPIDGWPDTAVATGSLQDQVSVGADENVTFAFAAELSDLPELTSNGLPVSYEVNGDTLTASTEAGEVFTLTLNSEGDYVFTLTGALDHDAGQGENLEVINFSSIIEATDFDGDTITLDNDFYIKIVDDMPVATGESVSVTVDEDDIQTDNSSGNDSFDNDSDGSYTGEPVTVFGYTTDFFNIFNGGGPATTSGSVATLVSFGADENGAFSLGSDFAALEAQNLTSKGDELSFEVNGDTLVASADGRAVFTLELDDNGDFTFSLYDQLDHATGNGENNLPLDLSSVIQATDSDLDTITLDSGFTIDVTDDVPEYAGAPDLGIVEEEALPAGNQEENDGSFFGIPLDGWPDTAVATGSLQDQVSVGADDDATFSLSGDYTSLIAQNLTSNDVPVTYQLDGDTLTASAGQTPVFTLTLSSNGDYIFTLMGPLDHPESYVEENPLVIDLSGVVIAEDFDGDAITLNNDLFIKIIDDSPEVAENAVVGLDDDALAGGNPGGTGDDANAVNVTGTLSHSFGADGGSISWQTSGAPSGFTYEASGDDLLIKQGGETVLTLSLNPETGEYSVTQNAPIKHQDDGNNDENNQLFNVGYLVTDNDDDTATGSLQINVDDDTPTVAEFNVNTMRIISDDDTANPYGNPGEGSNTNDGAGTDSKEYNQVKTLQFSAGADGGTVAWNVDNSSVDDATAGISFSVNGDGSLIITQMQNGVAVQVAEITLDANTGDYNYTQTSNVLHTPGDNENEAAFTLGFTVTDGDGDTADGYLTLLIDDDTPVVTSQQLSLLTESFEDFAPELSGNNWTVVGGGGGTIIGNNGIEWTVNGAGIEIQSGNVGGASASDGDVHAELDAHDSNGDGGSTLTKLSTEVDLPTADATLSFDFQPRPSDVDGSDMTVSLGGQEVTINVDGSGVIDFGTLPSGVSASQSSSAGGWTTITLSFTGLDTNSAQNLSFEGQGSANTLGAYIDNISLNAVANLTVDESALADGSGEAGASTTAVYDFSGFFTGEFGADGPADADSESYALNLNGADVGSGLFVVDNTDTSSTDGDGFGQGEEILLNQDGNQIVGSAGGVDYFTISVNDDGEVTLTQLENIWHADTTNPDDSQSMVLDAEQLTLVKTITDADQDSAEATLDLGGVNFNFEDDAPAIEAQQPAQPYQLTITNEGGDAGYNNTYGYFIKGDNGEPEFGQIIWANVKDNESSEVTVEVTDPSDIGFFIIPDGDDLNDLNNGDAVTFEQDGDGNWQVVLDGEPLSGQGTNVLFNDAALNQGGAQAVEDNAAAGNQNWEDIIGGDNDFNDVNINVSISQLGAITVDETYIGNGDPSSATATLDLSGSFTADFGADGEGDVDYGLSVDTDVNTGLIDTQSGEEVLLRVVDGEVEGYINDGSDQVVFTVTVDSDGEVTLTQLRAVEHDDATDPDEANSPATINAGAISLVATVSDADGDSADASLDLGVLFAFEDDGPSVDRNPVARVDDDVIGGNEGGIGDGPDANFVTGTLGHDFGQDGAGSIAWSTDVSLAPNLDGFTFENGVNEGELLIKQDGETVLTLTLNSETGEYTVTQNAAIDHKDARNENNQNFEVTYIVTDGDGDTAEGLLKISVDDDTPTIDKASHLSVQEADVDNDGFDVIEANGQLSHINEGADGATVTSMSLQASADFNTLKVGGEDVVASQTGNVITVNTVGGEPVFELTYNSDGEYTYKQFQAFDHQNDNPNRDNSEIIKLGFNFIVTDGDGDTAEGSLIVTVNDDEPVARYSSINVAELDADNDGEFDVIQQVQQAFNFDQGADGAEVTAIEMHNVKADGTVNIWNGGGADVFTLSSGGENIILTEDGSTITGTVGENGPTAFTIELNNDGTYTYTQYQPLDHAQTPNGQADNQFTLSFKYTVTDADGDTDQAYVGINIEDDVPSVGSASHLSVQETDTDNDGFDVIEANGQLSNITEGADGATVTSMSLQASADFNTLRVGGEEVVASQTGNVITVDTVGGEPVFELTYNSDGEYTYKQFQAFDHQNDNPNRDNSEVIKLGFNFTVTDADGDTDDGLLVVQVNDDEPVALDDSDSVVDGVAEGNVVTAESTDGESGVDSFGADGAGSVTSVTFGNTTYDVPSEGSVDIDGDFGTLTLHADGSYEYNVNSENVPQNTETVEGWTNNGSNMTAFNLGESFLDADGKFSDSGNGTVTSGGNTQGFGVAGTSGANTSVPEQVNQSGSQSEALAFKFTGDVTSATVQFSNLFNNENGGEAMRWHAFDADGNRIDSGIVSNNDASDPYAGDTTVSYSSNNEGSFTISDIGAFSTLVFEGVPYSNDGSDGADDSDFFVNITSYEVFGTESNQYQDQFTYEITDADGDSDSATLTINGQSEPEQGELDAIAPVAADNTYQVDGETSGNIITDDDDNGGAETGRDYDNDTPVINLSINSVIVNGVETELTADNTVIGLENGTLVINLDGSYTYTPDQDADGGDEFDYTLVDPDGEVSEPATVTLLEPLVSDVVTLGDVTVNEGDGTASITGSVENPVTGSPLVINLSNGATITIPVGHTSAGSTPFSIQGDDVYLDGGSYTVEVTGTTGGNYSSLDTSDDATVTISDTIDTSTVTLDNVSVAEDGTITYSASVDNAPQGNLTITLTNGVVITIPDGATTGSSAPQAAQGDDVYVDGESFNVGIQSTSGGNYEHLDTTDTATVTISDTTDTVIATLTTSTTEVSEDGGDITYTITLTGGPGSVDPDSDLVFNLANGDQVTVLAGQTSGSVVSTYTDAEITNQAAITNSIAGVASGGTEYESLQTAGTTSVDVNYTPEISDLTPAANGGDVSVDEDDLTDGSDTTKESTTQEGTFTISSGDAIDDLSIDGHAVITDGVFGATSFTTALGNTLSVTSYDANTGEITYTYELTDNTLSHGPANNGENGVFENFTVTLSDVDGDLANDTLSVQIIDDTPTAVADTIESSEGGSSTLGADLVLMIDVSGSVSNSDLSSLKSSLQTMFNNGSVHSVFITSFSSSGSFHDSGVDGGWFTNLSDAMGVINGLTSGGTTDYDAALQAVTDNFTAPPAGGGQLVSMFISDGEPNETNGTGSYGIIGAEETAWITFLDSNGFDNSYAVGYNGLDSGDIAYLEPIAWTEGETDSTHTGSDDDNVIILDDVDDLSSTLNTTVVSTPNPVTGNVLDNDTAGADGYGTPVLVDVTYDGNTVTFSGSTTSATFNTAAGEVVINSDGSYEFTGLSDTNTDVSAVINYTIQDADGDQSNSNLVVTTKDSVPTAVNDVDDVDEATWSIDGTESASVMVEGWSDTSSTSSDSLNGSHRVNANPSGRYGSDTDVSHSFHIDADADHPAAVSVYVNVSNFYTNYDSARVDLLKDGIQVDSANVYSDGDINFSNLTEEGNYQVRLFVEDNTYWYRAEASLSNLRVTSYNYGQKEITTTVNTAALAALAAATGNVLANDDAGADGGLSVTEVNGDAVSGSTNIDGLYGTLTIDENGDYTYTPNVEDLPAGMSDSFTYTVTDADGSEDTATLTIDINDHDYVVDDSDNVAVADAAGGSVNALDGDDVLIGSDQADILMGGAGNDNLMGNDGDDTLIGGAGNDILTGGAGADIFKWESGDEGTTDNPAVDFVTDFSTAEGDSLNLADLLQGEESGDITDYISVAQNGSDVVIEVTPEGNGGDMNQIITLQNTTVDQLAGGDTSSMSQADIINTLINNGQLNVDQS